MNNQEAIKVTDIQQEIFDLTKQNDEIDVQTMVQNCAKLIAPVWPLETFIACNPLHGFESMPFEEAIICSDALLDKSGNNESLKAVNLQMIKWCGAFLDVGQGTINLPHRDKGFYFGFLKLAPFDKQLHKSQQAMKDWLSALPENAEHAIKLCLVYLQIPKEKQEQFIKETLFYLPGWAGFVKWRSEWKNTIDTESKPINLMDFLAVRLIITCLLWPEAGREKKKKKVNFLAKQTIQKIKRNEDEYRQQLLQTLLPELQKTKCGSKRADVQLVFCIDVRSEPFRRAIESLGKYETLGFAGFFGLPVRVKKFDNGKAIDSCPVLLKPQFHIDEVVDSSEVALLERHQTVKNIYDAFKTIYQQLKYNFSTPFVLAESLGLWCGIAMFLKSVTPLSYLSKKLSKAVKPSLETKPCCETDEQNLVKGISIDEQIVYAETILRLMSLTENFAKIIVFCGHGSSTQNNPYASALDCGACGGNHGGINAKLLAQILNKKIVRQKLNEKDIHIPVDTFFLGAQHDTTTDSVVLYSADNNQSSYPWLLEKLKKDLEAAKFKNNLERSRNLKGVNTAKKLERSSIDWSETRPEWGLARNAAFIIAPRFLTENINLNGRCFLHSYRWEQDTDGTLLQTILTAPMVVAQWINTQYLFSTIDNIMYGSGSKITHNVTGKIGIMQGNGSDLMHGLPLQSVMLDDQTAYHCPQRLLTVVYAKKAMVSNIIEQQPVLKVLFLNDWVHLVVIDPQDNLPYRLKTDGNWYVAQ